VSEALDAALAVGGVKSSVRIAHFTHGTVRDILLASGTLLAEAPLTFDMTQIDLGYDIAPQQGTLLKTFTIGFRYFDYTLPRILYEFVNTTRGPITRPTSFRGRRPRRRSARASTWRTSRRGSRSK